MAGLHRQRNGRFVLFTGGGLPDVPFDTLMIGGAATSSAAALQKDNDELRASLSNQSKELLAANGRASSLAKQLADIQDSMAENDDAKLAEQSRIRELVRTRGLPQGV